MVELTGLVFADIAARCLMNSARYERIGTSGLAHILDVAYDMLMGHKSLSQPTTD
jgi:hypothetical protein